MINQYNDSKWVHNLPVTEIAKHSLGN